MFQADLELRRQIDLLVEFFRKYLPGYENCKYIASGTTTGIRETRRVIGEYYITAEEMAVGKRFEDVVVHKAEFVVDIHNPIGPGQAEAKLQYCDPYDLPYGALYQRRSTDCSSLAAVSPVLTGPMLPIVSCPSVWPWVRPSELLLPCAQLPM